MIYTFKDTTHAACVYGKEFVCPEMGSDVAPRTNKYDASAGCNRGAKSCGFRGAMDTNGCRIPAMNGVLVYRPRRLVYQNLCRPFELITVKSGLRQKFGSPADGVSPLGDLDNRGVRRSSRRVSL